MDSTLGSSNFSQIFFVLFSGLSPQIPILEVLAEPKHLLTSTADDCNENGL